VHGVVSNVPGRQRKRIKFERGIHSVLLRYIYMIGLEGWGWGNRCFGE
jgi:hypothetical protein